MEKQKMGVGICAILLLAGAISPGAAEVKPGEIPEKAVARFSGELRKKLMESMRENGPAGSINVCAREAPAITTRIEQELGVAIKRTALKIRNPRNAPDPTEKELLQTLAAAHQAGETIPQGVTPFPDNRRRFYKVILIQKTCLACHGNPGAINEGVRREIAATYPDDRTTGYKEGDFRGIISVNVK